MFAYFTKDGGTKSRHVRFAGLFLALLLVGSLVLSYSVYRKLVHNEEQQFEETLNHVADVRSAALSAWVHERLGDALVFGGGKFLGEAISDWMARGSPEDAVKRQLREQLAAIKATYGYLEVTILDTAGNVLISTANEPAPLDLVARQVIQSAIDNQRIEISSIHSTLANTFADRIVDIAGPVFSSSNDDDSISSVLLLRADANLPLNPFVHSIPLLNASAEMFLVEIIDGKVVAAARNTDGGRAPFQGAVPVTPQQLQDAAISADKHFILHTHNGSSWISTAREIPDTPWFLVTMINQDEIRHNLQRLAWAVAAISAGVAALLGLAGLSWSRKKESDMRLRALQATTERQLLQRQYDYLSKYANDMIILTNAAGAILEVNDKATQLLGHDREALLRSHLEDVFLPSCREQLSAALSKLRDEGTAVFELAHYRADGTILPVEVSARSIELSGEHFIQLISRDISERKQSQAELQESRDKLNGILASIHDVVWSFSPGLDRLNYMNRTVENVYGYPVSAFEQNPRLWLELISDEDRPRVLQALHALSPQHSSCEEEFRIVRRDGAIRWLHCRSSMAFDHAQRPLRIDGVTTDITLRKEAEQQVHSLAYYDNVTTLPNRALLNDRLAQATHMAQRSRKKVAVLFMDLDNFKNVNDSLGHQIGDLLLRTIGERLQQCVRDEDTVSRIGGDEFVVVLPDLDRGEQAVPAAEKILAITAHPFTLQEQQVHTTISIGISVYPDDGTDPAELLKHADAALYQAKSQGRNNYQFFTQELNRQITRSSSVERQLRHAIDAGELHLLYQPQIDTLSGRVVGAEALLRWRTQNKDFLSPAEFIPVAEERGLIGKIGEWVLREACMQCRRWQQEGLRTLPISVNVSPLQFQQKDFAGFVTRLLDDIHLDPVCLELEITESAIMRRATQVAELTMKLRNAGVKISIDDFGTGYSSLSYLKHIPIDKIKIDRSFIADMLDDPDDEAITLAIINLAHSLKLRVIAEGVESGEQLELLRRFGCHEVQGYYYSSAVPADTLRDYLANDKIFAEPVT